MYSLDGYGQMIEDRQRIAAYEEALRSAVGPDSVVLDIGTGTGIMALLACRFGARRVVAVEPSPLIHVAARAATENGVADRIDFFRGTSQQLVLEEPADVIVSDLRGVLPLHPGNIPSVVDARRRLLAPGGVLIPARDRLWAAPVEAPKAFDSMVTPWRDRPLDFAMIAAEQAAVNDWIRVEKTQLRLLGEGIPLFELDYGSVGQPDMDATAELTIDAEGTAHGFVVWFDTELADGVELSNNPSDDGHIYGQAFFPLERPMAVAQGDRLRIRLRARLVEGEYAWFWRWKVLGGDDGDTVVAVGDQSSVFKELPSPAVAELPGANEAFALNGEGRAVRTALELIDQRRSVAQISGDLASEFPDRFGDAAEAAVLVRKLVNRYGGDPGNSESSP